ncbi:MAG: insulinase family protein, partial [Candidatus Eisenbacteria bacterium]|nr:insulinase family protein [Candidatus Eisenbacteria bacterium]
MRRQSNRAQQMQEIMLLLILIGLLLAPAAPCSAQGFSFRPVLIPSSEMPTIAIRVLFETGSGDDPNGREGLCSVAALTMAGGGTSDLSHWDVVNALYPYAAQIHVQVDKDYTVFTATFHREVLESVYPVFRDLLTRPRWDPDDFQREWNDAVNFINRELVGENDEELGKAALEKFIYGAGPYGHPIRGTTTGLDSITLADAQKFALEHFVRARMRVGIAGAYLNTFPGRVMTDLNLLPEGT